MQEDGERPQLSYRDARFRRRTPRLLTKIIAVAGGALVLAGAVAISIVVFAFALAGVVLFAIYFWWKTRSLRKQMREQRRDDDVIEGEVIRKEESPPRP
jgi:hypothetical protein